MDVKSINTTWPKFDAKFQRYLNISRDMSPDSVGQRYCARASHFWGSMLPEVAAAARAGSYRTETFCERDGGCVP